MQPFVNISTVFCLYPALHNRRCMSSNSLVFHTSSISSRSAVFLHLILFKTTSSYSSVNCLNLMSCQLRIFFSVDFGNHPEMTHKPTEKNILSRQAGS